MRKTATAMGLLIAVVLAAPAAAQSERAQNGPRDGRQATPPAGHELYHSFYEA